MTTEEIHQLWHAWQAAWQAADDAWSKELRRLFHRDAGTARYQARGTSTPELKRLHDEFRRAGDAWREAAYPAKVAS